MIIHERPNYLIPTRSAETNKNGFPPTPVMNRFCGHPRGGGVNVMNQMKAIEYVERIGFCFVFVYVFLPGGMLV